MVYCGTAASEMIMVHPMDNLNETRIIEMVKAAHDPKFIVTVEVADDYVYAWEFWMEDNSLYERVKLNIFDCIFEYDTMEEIASALDEIFEDGFSDVLVRECDEDCNECMRRN